MMMHSFRSISTTVVAVVLSCYIPGLLATKHCLTLQGTISCEIAEPNFDQQHAADHPPPSNNRLGNTNVLENIDVTAYDADFMNPDDLIGRDYTDATGHYMIHGCAEDPLGKIEPYLYITHQCRREGSQKIEKVNVPLKCLDSECQIDFTIKATDTTSTVRCSDVEATWHIC